MLSTIATRRRRCCHRCSRRGHTPLWGENSNKSIQHRWVRPAARRATACCGVEEPSATAWLLSISRRRHPVDYYDGGCAQIRK